MYLTLALVSSTLFFSSTTFSPCHSKRDYRICTAMCLLWNNQAVQVETCVNVPTCHASRKLVSKHLIPQEKEFQEFTTLLKSLPAELFAADSRSWHAEPAGPAIWLASHSGKLSGLLLVSFLLQDSEESVPDHSSLWPVYSQVVSPAIIQQNILFKGTLLALNNIYVQCMKTFGICGMYRHNICDHVEFTVKYMVQYLQINRQPRVRKL